MLYVGAVVTSCHPARLLAHSFV